MRSFFSSDEEELEGAAAAGSSNSMNSYVTPAAAGATSPSTSGGRHRRASLKVFNEIHTCLRGHLWFLVIVQGIYSTDSSFSDCARGGVLPLWRERERKREI